MAERESGIISEWAQQLAGLMVLGFCVVISMPRPKPKVDALPSVIGSELPGTGHMSAEAQEFMNLPPHIRKQALDYARRWIDASFERED